MAIAAEKRVTVPPTIVVLLIVILSYVAVVAPILHRHHFNPSVFIGAGDRFVDATNVETPIFIRKGLDGYDGQFYYRLARSPFSTEFNANGVSFDNGPWRMQRIVYPLLAFALSFGQADLTPAALLIVNLLGLVAIVIFARRLVDRLDLPIAALAAAMLWPGLIVTITHDTTEIVSAAFILGALDRYLAGRMLEFAVFAALASLTREIGVLVFAGIFCLDIVRRRYDWAAICALAMVPFLAWRVTQFFLWGAWPSASNTTDLTWPIVATVEMLIGRTGVLVDAITTKQWAAALATTYRLAASMFIVTACIWFAFEAVRRLRNPHDSAAAIAAGVLPLLALMSMLTSSGPWIDQNGFFRAFLEVYMIGCLLVSRAISKTIIFRLCFVSLAFLWTGTALWVQLPTM